MQRLDRNAILRIKKKERHQRVDTLQFTFSDLSELKAVEIHQTKEVMITKAVKKNLAMLAEWEKHNIAFMEHEESEINWNIEFAQKMFPNWIVLVCKAGEARVKFISENCYDFLGYKAQAFQRLQAEEYYTQFIHSDDQENLGLCFEYMIDRCKENTGDPTDLRFITNYRFKHSNGTYLHLQEEKFLVKSRTGKLIPITLFKDISATSNFSQVKIEMLRHSKQKTIKTDVYIPFVPDTKVTQRELTIIGLIREGFNNKEIAEKLFISINTVKNHRRNLFKKTRVRNSLQLLNYAQSVNLL
jgi:DNA-binding CsgD family transcriptional regulator